ncbi:MAG: glucuronate isomerase [bacterium ADurb.Bin429]|nr:MAG: glucuronate isomerase [bacterium ADurb.Bin429]
MPTYDNAYAALMETLEALEIVDSHEHLPSEAARVAQTPDFSLFFSHYCYSDLLSAGMPKADARRFIFDSASSVEEKWALVSPYYSAIADGSYARAAHLAMERFYGISRLESLADAEALTRAIRANNTPGLYRRVLKEACRIRLSLNFGNLDDDPEFFAPVIFVNPVVETQPAAFEALEAHSGVPCTSLDRYIEALRGLLRSYHARGMKGLKHSLAYMRDLHFAPVTHADAEAMFNRLTEEGYGWRDAVLGYQERRPLQDYLVHRLCEIAAELDVPFVMHTGMQAHDRHRADDARPGHLWNLPLRFTATRFVLLHAGFPWLEDAAMLAKQYPNVYLDLAWVHLMSPEIAVRELRAIVDLVPMNKVIGFGGDYCVVEKIYGHLILARRNLARVFAEKVAAGDLTLPRAEAWLRAMLRENPAHLYAV